MFAARSAVERSRGKQTSEPNVVCIVPIPKTVQMLCKLQPKRSQIQSSDGDVAVKGVTDRFAPSH